MSYSGIFGCTRSLEITAITVRGRLCTLSVLPSRLKALPKLATVKRRNLTWPRVERPTTIPSDDVSSIDDLSPSGGTSSSDNASSSDNGSSSDNTSSNGDNTEVEDGDASCEKTQDMPQTMRAPQTSLRKTSVMEDVEEHDSDEEQADQSMDENDNSEPSPE
ncbi:uncharacterized protein PITG_16749 [Phytophthora infestans T30-4]|uniref:Uncharacterized protein n=1 Tax=Phytophthora infestans (strain T30-4) TaxID=403677 RepID=D0NVJ0_PHYIT|nr:uncharacterized protein PITG_16749 [Phytophthora infestans T30-4]EEY66667.1 hypothetical protein PITG_16749 [Phytophthora infestans T30-4]|eukprot:XP_002896968.1 hypothetical protein PITG_16749 [Phytophthora infestans T30-4]